MVRDLSGTQIKASRMNPTFRRVLFRLHWLAGLGAGGFLLVIGLSGGLLGVEQPALDWLNPQLRLHTTADAHRLTPDAWVAAARRSHPDLRVRRLNWDGDERAVQVDMVRNGRRGGIAIAVDPYTGRVLGNVHGDAFFHTVEQVHKTLAAGAVGRQLVAASTALLWVLTLSGLVLRWPRRRRLAPATWLRPEMRLRGRGLLRSLHAVAGTWLLLCYLLVSLTGLWWSYDFVRRAINGLAGVTVAHHAHRPAPATPGLPGSIDNAWEGFRRSTPQATRAMVILGGGASAPLQVRYQDPEAPHARAWNSVTLDPASGRVLGRQRYADLPAGRRLPGTVFALHSGELLGWPGRIAMLLAALSLPAFTVTGVWLWLWRRRSPRTRRQHEAGTNGASSLRCASRRDRTLPSPEARRR